MVQFFGRRMIWAAAGLGGLVLGLLLSGFNGFAATTSTKDLQDVLSQRLTELNAEIAAYRTQIQQYKVQRTTLENDITVLDLEIKKTQRQIEATDVAIRESSANIDHLSAKIETLEAELARRRGVLAHYVQLLNEQDRESLVEVVLAEDNFHDFFSKYQAFKSIQAAMLASMTKVQAAKGDLEGEKTAEEEQREEDLQLKAIQQLQKRSLEKKVAAKQDLIEQSKVQTTILAGRQQEAEQAVEQVKKNLYVLQGLSGSLTLADAYARASKVANKVGIRPAFLMAVLKKESDWGSNIGSGHWRRDMHPRDHAAFLAITKKLGLDPDAMPVSAKPVYGWGGAMGPAQFLPTTWLAYEDEIAIITGHNPPSPWDLDDAFAAAALKLSANGANQKTWPAEWKAAQVYFAGRNWQKPQYSFYGDSVMELAEVIQNQIIGSPP